LQEGFSPDQLVHDYGDLCQAVAELSIETSAKITNIEFRTLNRCLDNAIANAVTEYSRGRDQTDKSAANGNRDLLVDQLNLINMAIVAMDAIQARKVGTAGATGGGLARTLRGLQDLTARALANVQLRAGIARQH
jgi:hypothetical protein